MQAVLWSRCRNAELIARAGLPVVLVRQLRRSSEFALRLLLAAEARQDEPEIVVAGLVVGRRGNCAVQETERLVVVLLAKTGLAGTRQSATVFGIASQSLAEVSQRLVVLSLLQGDVAELVPSLGLRRMETN